ncbi:hypothetical protein GF325_15810 [Candidatus Bathyarchaeota archaeon]|nr:hypothetical protein [Candidatus Bathyarchaeota archaeon]
MVRIVGKVRWATIIALGLMIGLVALFILILGNTICWDCGWGEILLGLLFPFLASGLVAGFIGGLVAHTGKHGLLPGMITAIVVTLIQGVLILLNATLGLNTVPTDVEENPMTFFIPVIFILITMLPMGAIGGAISLRNITLSPPGKGEKEKGLFSAFKKPLFVVIFILAWTPLIVPLLSIDTNIDKPYSAWNDKPSGMNTFKEQVEAAGYTNTVSCISSYSLLSRIEEQSLLVILGPNRFFNPISDVPFLIDFFRKNGSMLIAHEQGSTSWLMYDAFAASLPSLATGGSIFPFMMFSQGILRDNVSYYKENQFPVIGAGNLGSHPITSGISSIVLNKAGGLVTIPGMDIFGWEIVATSTDGYSWVDRKQEGYPDGNYQYNPSVDKFDIPIEFEWALKKMGITIVGGVPMGGFPIPVIAATQYSTGGSGGRVVCTSDASIFSNQMISLPGFDNLQFALNCIDWLTGSNTSMKIIFDEAHLKPGTFQDTTVPAIYGTVLGYVGYLSSNWFTAPFYPFIALVSIKRWLPKSETEKLKEERKRKAREEKRQKKLQKKARRKRRVLGKLVYGKKLTKREKKNIQGVLKKSTYFMQKLTWYMEQSEYNQALGLLYNRLKRLIGKKFGSGTSHDVVIHAIMERNPSVNHGSLTRFFKQMERVVSKTRKLRVRRQDFFEKLYFEMITVQEYIESIQEEYVP